MTNEYYNRWREVNDGVGNNYFLNFSQRTNLAVEFAWAIPNDEALNAIKALGMPIVEIGAGSGYWAKLLQDMGVGIVPIDSEPIPNSYVTKRYTDIIQGSVELLEQYPNHALMLCWPPYDKPMAADALKAYLGKTVIYIGEGYGGCTGDDEFHHLLDKYWEFTVDVDIPQWYGIHDRLYIYERK